MSALAATFLFLPSAVAVLVAWLVSDWRMGGLVAATGMAVLIVLLAVRLPYVVFLMPVLSGAVVGGITSLSILRWRPESVVWTRMTFALIVAFVAHLFLLDTLSLNG